MKKHSTKFLSIMIALAVIFSIAPAAWAKDAVMSGDGSKESPYIIEDAADLKLFRDKVNGGERTICAKLDKDIDLGGEQWVPIGGNDGYVTSYYGGTFDGNGKTVSNFVIDAAYNYAGFFSYLKNDVHIKNLSIKNARITSKKNNCGGIAGTIVDGSIENCLFEGTITNTASNGYSGGICGYLGNKNTSPQIYACVNRGSIKAKYAGGITGYAKFSKAIENCYNTGNIEGTSRTGGIVGQNMNGVSVKNCYSIGTVSGTGTGGISGFNGVSLSNCYWLNADVISGGGAGSAENCEEIKSTENLAEKLGEAYIRDENNINGGYPILTWQNGDKQDAKNPRVEIYGESVLEMTNETPRPQTTLYAECKDMEEIPVIEWNLKQGGDIVEISAPVSPDEGNTKLVVKAKKSGKAVIEAKAGEYSAEFGVTVYPIITTIGYNDTKATIHGEEVVVGSRVFANVYTTDGEYDYSAMPELKYQWRYSSDAINYINIPGAVNREYTVGQDYEDCRIDCVVETAKSKYNNYFLSVIGAEYAGLLYDEKNLAIDESDIKENKTINLPGKGEKGTDIAWESSNSSIINPETGEVILPDSGIEEIKLTARLSHGEKFKIRSFTIKVYSAEAAETERSDNRKKLEDISAKLGGGYYKLYPVFKKDKNVLDMVRADIAGLSDEDITVSMSDVREIYGGASIAENGDITYYYNDPNEVSVMHSARYDADFTLTLGDAEYKITVPIMIYWDSDKAESVMKTEILDKVEIGSKSDVTEDISLPKVVDGKKWAIISWTSSDSDALSVSSKNQQTADTLFDPYVGVVRRGAEDKKVILTAVCTFGLTNDGEEPIVLTKVFEVTVKAIDEDTAAQIKNNLSEKLKKGFDSAGLTDAVTKKPLEENNGIYTAYNDIKFPTTHDFGVDGSINPVVITSSDNDVISEPDVNNAARVQVLRPAVGKEEANVTVTVSIRDKDTNISAEKSFNIIVPALTEEEINAEKALMEKVLTAYFDGIKGGNTNAKNITGNLAPFTEVYEKDGQLVWVRNDAGMTGSGIVPEPMEGWEELEAWRLFKSSNPSVITHENLLVSMQKDAKAVTVSSALSSETLGIYGKLYKSGDERYADYAGLADLYYRPVDAELFVRGTDTPKNAMPSPKEEKVNAEFSLTNNGKTLINSVKYQNLEEGSTVFDVFKKALADSGYTYTAIKSYVSAITTPSGETIKEKDAGANSGWMYKVNGKLPNVVMSEYYLKDGDEIEVYYTHDYTKETDSTHTNPSGTTKKDKTNTFKPAAQEKNTGFGDAAGHWAKEYIEKVKNSGLMQGVSDTEFAPDIPLTRGMFITIIYRAESEPAAENSKFSDITDGSWYAKAVSWGSSNDIVSGISDTEFAPDMQITREQMAVMIYRYAKSKGFVTPSENTDTSGYSDFDQVSEYAREALIWAIGNKIISGKTAGTLNPLDTATRAETAVVITKTLALLNMAL